MLAKKVDTILVGFEEAKQRLPKAKNVVVTGTPTKIKGIAMSQAQKDIMKKEMGLKNDLPVILIFGGSQGAKTINETLKLPPIPPRNRGFLKIRQNGRKFFDRFHKVFCAERMLKR